MVGAPARRVQSGISARPLLIDATVELRGDPRRAAPGHATVLPSALIEHRVSSDELDTAGAGAIGERRRTANP